MVAAFGASNPPATASRPLGHWASADPSWSLGMLVESERSSRAAARSACNTRRRRRGRTAPWLTRAETPLAAALASGVERQHRCAGFREGASNPPETAFLRGSHLATRCAFAPEATLKRFELGSSAAGGDRAGGQQASHDGDGRKRSGPHAVPPPIDSGDPSSTTRASAPGCVRAPVVAAAPRTARPSEAGPRRATRARESHRHGPAHRRPGRVASP